LIGAKERTQGTGRSVGSQTCATTSMVRLPESHQEEALHKVSEIRALRKKGLSEDEIAKRLTHAGMICS
jgi:hypothetical protein